MSAINEFHNKAMDLSELAFMARMRGDKDKAIALFSDALDAELAAIAALDEPIEPTFSVLHRSAGTIAFHCGQLRKAEQLAAAALAKDPPPEIAEELRDLMEQVTFKRHLELKGITLSEDELQMSLSGQAVSFGLVNADEIFNRVNDSSRLIKRIAERQRKSPFRERGSPPNDIREGYQLFVSAPRAASFAVTLKLSGPVGQLHLPFNAIEVVDEFVDLMELVNNARTTDIQEVIPDIGYLRNFLGLAKKIAPDGDRIRQVGFTLSRNGTERSVSVTRPASEFPLLPIAEAPTSMEPVEIQGTLLFADAIRRDVSKIRVVDESRKSHSVEVPEGMMNDIVRPMWNSVVTIKGLRKGRVIELQDIWASEAY